MTHYFCFILNNAGHGEANGLDIGYDRWSRMAILFHLASNWLCRDILFNREALPFDGAQLFQELNNCRNEEKWRKLPEKIKKVIFPSSGFIDLSKLEMSTYKHIIELKFPSEYKDTLHDLKDLKNLVYHMGDKELSETYFDSYLEMVVSKFKKHGFTLVSVQDPKTGTFKGNIENFH